MKALVVGGLGFIGHWVVRKLEDRGIDCRVVDCEKIYSNQNANWMRSVYESRARQITSPVYEDDILDREKVKKILLEYQPDIIIWSAGIPNQASTELNLNNATKNSVEALNNFLRYRSTKRFVFLSSSMVYGNFTEPVKETDPVNPVNEYGLLKLAGESLVKSTDIPYTIIRPSAVYGPRDSDTRVIYRWLANANNGLPIVVQGENEKCDFTWIGDLAWGIVEAALSPNAENKTYNLTRGSAVSLPIVAEEIKKITQSESEIIITEKSDKVPSRSTLLIDNAKKDFGFDPKTDIITGIKMYQLWLQQYERPV